jgi:hypothetical protein
MNTVTENANIFADAPVAARPTGASTAVANTDQQRAVAEVQAAMMIARMNPRDPIVSMDRILNACARPGLADAAVYTYARGGTDISGPSIRLAEAMAQSWGNLQFGIRELEQHGGMSTVQAFAWDVETNVRREVTFQVPHIRHTKKGSYKLEDPRDIYESVANNGARRLRACILAVIPGDVTEAAVSQCEVTMKTKADTSPEAMAKMVTAFEPFGVTKDQIEARIQRRLDAIQPAQVVSLKKIYASLRDGISVADDWFEVAAAAEGAASEGTQGTRTDAVKEALKKKAPATVDQSTGEIKSDASNGGAKPEATGAPAVNYEALLKRLQTGGSIDALDADASLIGELADFGERNAATKIYTDRRAELTAPKGKK